MKFQIRPILVLALIVIIGMGVIPTESTGKAAAGKVVIAMPTLAGENPNPFFMSGSSDNNYQDFIHGRLVWTGLNGKPDPDWSIAESWQMSPDGKSFTFDIRKGMTFHNGDPVTAADVKFTIEKLLEPGTKAINVPFFKRPVASVDILNDYKVRVNLKAPQPNWVNANIVDRNLWIVPKNYYEKMGDMDFSKKPIGCGPYKFVRQSKGEYMEFEAFDNYWQGAPKVKNVRLEIVPEDSTRLAKLKAGEIDVMGTVPAFMAPEISGTKGLRIMSSKSTCYLEACLNKYFKNADTWGAPFMKQDVRLALNHAINREDIAKSLYRGLAAPAVTLFGRGSFGANPSLKPYPYDPKKAKQLLAKAGYPNGFEMKIYTAPNNYISSAVEVAQILQKYWADIGVKAAITQLEYGTLTKKQRAGEFDGISINGAGVVSDSYLRLSTCSVSTGPMGGYIPDPEWEAFVLKEIPSTLDDKERERKLQEAEKIVYDRAIHIAIVLGDTVFGVGPRIADWKLTPYCPFLRNVHLMELKD